ncbi:MAG: glutamine-hydrolyzing GMP synthase, partial [Bdellovibrionales bacterium]|nr:glutamine-hydrolyzing GMP synthase [Bdellovibrionales bacterium]
MILILDYGSQYTQLIARRIREKNVYCEILPYNADLKLLQQDVEGIVLSGGPSSVYANEAPWLPDEVISWNKPVLGICYGAQLMIHKLGGHVASAKAREFGHAHVVFKKKDPLFQRLTTDHAYSVWMSHGDRVEKLANQFIVIGESANSPYAVIRHESKPYYGVQFHPEVAHTSIGEKIISNFLFEICRAKKDWTMQNFLKSQIESIKQRVGKKHVICGVSGGVDSSVVAVLLNEALGDQLTSIFVDHGLLRKDERQEVDGYLKQHFKLNLKTIDASDKFFQALGDQEDPEFKRKTIGRMFVEVFEEEAKKIPNV